MKAISILAAMTALAGCTTMSGAGGDSQFAACAAYKPAYDVTDEFMRTFNTKEAEAWGATFHFPSVRIASGNVRIINSPADLENSFTRLEEQGWHHSSLAVP